VTRAVGIVALIGLTAACGGEKTPTPPSSTPPATFSLTGRVTDSGTASGIAGATLTIVDSVNVGKSATTDGSGNYSFTGLQPAGFTISVTAANYVSTAGGVTLTANQSLTFQLARLAFRISGRVSDAVSGVSVGNVAIDLTDASGLVRSTRSDAGGNYGIGNLLPGAFVVAASAPSYQSANRPVTISDNTSADFVLARSCTTPPGTPEFLGWTSAGLPSGSVQLSWQPKNDPILSYIVEVGTTVGGTDVAVIDTGSLSTSYLLTGLKTSVNMYHARIRARNACGLSAPSNEANPRIA
jgi:hypothetical protein